MEPTYYTPQLSEFHPGFEYEMDEGTGWSKQVFPAPWWTNGSMGGIDTLKRSLDIIRVKCLDKDDIIDCGWHILEGLNCPFASIGKADSKTPKYLLIINDKNIVIGEYSRTKNDDIAKHIPIFCGIIKNKSELKFQMDRLNITN